MAVDRPGVASPWLVRRPEHVCAVFPTEERRSAKRVGIAGEHVNVGEDLAVLDEQMNWLAEGLDVDSEGERHDEVDAAIAARLAVQIHRQVVRAGEFAFANQADELVALAQRSTAGVVGVELLPLLGLDRQEVSEKVVVHAALAGRTAPQASKILIGSSRPRVSA